MNPEQSQLESSPADEKQPPIPISWVSRADMITGDVYTLQVMCIHRVLGCPPIRALGVFRVS